MNVGLPPSAKGRLEGIARDEPWSSELGVGDDAVLRRMGFVPAGLVVGSVFSYVLSPTPPPGYKVSFRPMGWRPAWIDDPMSARVSGGYVHDWAVRDTGQPKWDLGWTWERMYHEKRERKAAGDAMARLVAEAKAIGAHGVLNVDFAFVKHGLVSSQMPDYPVFEMRVQGTAVRVPGRPAAEPFTTGMTAGDVWKLAQRGYAPSSFIVGIGCVRGQLGSSTRRHLRSLANREVDQFSEVTHHSFRIAREDLEQGSAGKGHLILGAAPKLDVERERRWIYDVTTRITASVLKRFHRFGGDAPLNFMPVVSADDAPQM